MSVKLAYAKGQKILQKEGRKCPPFKNVVMVWHEDGSFFSFQNATGKLQTIDKIEFLLVWTEHCGYHLFFLEDLERWVVLTDVLRDVLDKP